MGVVNGVDEGEVGGELEMGRMGRDRSVAVYFAEGDSPVWRWGLHLLIACSECWMSGMDSAC